MMMMMMMMKKKKKKKLMSVMTRNWRGEGNESVVVKK
jgi:hypothetical protein